MSEKTPHSINPEFQFWAKNKNADNVINGFREADEEGAFVLEEGIGFKFHYEDGSDIGSSVIQIGGEVKAGGVTEKLVSETYQLERADDKDHYFLISMMHAPADSKLEKKPKPYSPMVIFESVQGLTQLQEEGYPDNDDFLLHHGKRVVNLGYEGRLGVLHSLVNSEEKRIGWGMKQFMEKAFLTPSQREILEKVAANYNL